MRTLSRMVVVLGLFLLPVAAQAKAKVTLTPSQTTVATTQTQELTAVVTGTTNKNVKFHVCDSNGQNCVLGGNGTLGTIAESSRDANNNPIATYIAPAALPSATVCQSVDTGCRLKVRALLKVGLTKIKKFATVTLTAPGVTSSPTGGSDGNSRAPARSADGRFLAFASVATTLLGPGNDTNGAIQDVFLFDTCIGATGCTPGMTIVSVADDGTQGDGASNQPAISDNGRYVVFGSAATNLIGVGNDTNGAADIFMRDTCAGAEPSCISSTIRVSEGSAPDAPSSFPAVGGNGRYVAFMSSATNLIGAGNDTNGLADIFLRDTCIGAPLTPACTPTTTRVSEATGGTEVIGSSREPAVSADGRFVVFTSNAPTLVGSDGNGADDIFLRDTCQGAGVGCTPTTERVSVDTVEGDPSARSERPVISGNGRYVVFRSFATDLIVSDTNGITDIFLRDTCTGVPSGCTPATTRVSVRNDGGEASAGGDSLEPVVSRDGRFVAFRSFATDLVSGDTNLRSDIFVRDTCGGEPGCTPSTRRISVTSSGGEAADNVIEPSLSGDGRFAAFVTTADLTGGGGAGAIENVFLARTGVVIVPLAWVTNTTSDTVSVIDTETNTVIATIPVGDGPMGVALTPDGTRAYVTNSNDDTVSVIDTASRTVITTIPVGDGPRGVAITSDGQRVYVTNSLADSVSAISVTSNTVFDTIALPAGARPLGILIPRDQGQDEGAGTTSFGLDEITTFGTNPGDIDFHVLDNSIPIGDGPKGGADKSEGGVFTRAYITLENVDKVAVLDVTVEPNVVIKNIAVGDQPAGVAITPDGSRLYVANGGANTVSVINTSTNAVIKTITVGSNPKSVAVTPDGARVYVTNQGSNTVSVIDTATNAVVATIAVGTLPCCEMGIAIQLGSSL